MPKQRKKELQQLVEQLDNELKFHKKQFKDLQTQNKELNKLNTELNKLNKELSKLNGELSDTLNKIKLNSNDKLETIVEYSKEDKETIDLLESMIRQDKKVSNINAFKRSIKIIKEKY